MLFKNLKFKFKFLKTVRISNFPKLHQNELSKLEKYILMIKNYPMNTNTIIYARKLNV